MSSLTELLKLFEGYDAVYIVAVERGACRVYEFRTFPLEKFFQCFLSNGGSADTMDDVEDALREMFSISTTEGFVQDLYKISDHRRVDQEMNWVTNNGDIMCPSPTPRKYKNFTFMFIPEDACAS